jgi:hypothetical protein
MQHSTTLPYLWTLSTQQKQDNISLPKASHVCLVMQ